MQACSPSLGMLLVNARVPYCPEAVTMAGVSYCCGSVSSLRFHSSNPAHTQAVLPGWLTQREPAAHHLPQPVAGQHLQEAVIRDIDIPYALASMLVRPC